MAESGDYKSAAKLARNLANNPASLGHINADVYAAQQQAAQLSAIVNSAAFAVGNVGTTGSDVRITVDPLSDPTVLVAEMTRQVTHNVMAEVARQAG